MLVDRPRPQWRSALLIAAAAVAVLGLGAVAAAEAGHAQGLASRTNDQHPAAEARGDLLRVPVSNLTPGGVEHRPQIENPAGGDAAALGRGMRYFNAFNCVGCHAANGAGGMGPALSNRFFIYGAEPENIYLSIVQGRPNGMPAWGALLPDEVVWDLVAYIGSISSAPTPQWGTTVSATSPAIEQVPAEFQQTTTPWQYTQPFKKGQKP